MTERAKTKARRGRPPVRGPRQRAALLDAVTRQINSEGAGSIVLAELCAHLGLSRSSLYYYCRDATDLVFQAYLNACVLLTEDIAWAGALDAPADKQLTALINRILAQDRAPTAALNDVAILPPALKDRIDTAAGNNITQLGALLQAGQRGGIFCAFDTKLTAQLILNSIAWTIVSLPWLNRDDNAGAHQRFVDAFCDLLLNGIAPRATPVAPCDLVYERLISKPFNAFDKSQTAEIKAEQIVAAASRLFNQKGLDGVRLDDISNEIGASKGVIYHHFKDKAELIERCYDRAFAIYDLIMKTGIQEGATPLDSAYAVTHLNAQAQLSSVPPLALQPGLTRLSGSKRVEFRERARALSEVGAQNLQAGIDQGLARILDTDRIPQIIAGYFLGLPRLVTAGSDRRAVADLVSRTALFGIRA